MGFIVVIVIAVNLLISIRNAWVTGKAWVESKYAGGWPRLMTWMGAIMAASGMTWCILFVLVLLAVNLGKLTWYWADVALDLGYLIIIPGTLLSGALITVGSWARVYRTRKVLDLGFAGYNSFAQVYNTYNAIRGIGPAFGKVASAFFGGKDKKDGATIVIFLVVIALAAGVLITAAIIHHAAAAEPLPSYEEAQRRQQMQPA